MPRRLDDVRHAELLDGVMRIIAARGFSEVRIAEIARELRCSAATLYKIAPSKDSLVLLAIGRWGELTLGDLEASARQGTTASDCARRYFRAGAEERPGPFPRVLRRHRTLRVHAARVVDRRGRTLSQPVHRTGPACGGAGEIRPVNIRFLAEVLRGISFVTRSERVLSATGFTHEQAVLEVDSLLWDGLRTPFTTRHID